MHADVLNVDLGDRGYPIYIGSGLLGDAALLRRHLDSGPVALLSNVTVAPLYLERVKAALGERVAVVKLLPDGEQYKTLDVLATIYDALLESRCDRRTTVVALGGGVVGDMSGFAAATYQRGVSFLQLPTTLLAQVDSSVGGKTGVNHPRGKNMIGAFHQPRCVIADTDTLATLPAREFAAGVAEVIKYGLIGDLGFYRWLQAHSAVLMQRDPRILAQAIRRSCENKARVVAADEREEGLRALLNFGHTFAHAIETATAYGAFPAWRSGGDRHADGSGILLSTRLDCSRRGRGAAGVAARHRTSRAAALRNRSFAVSGIDGSGQESCGRSHPAGTAARPGRGSGQCGVSARGTAGIVAG